MNAAAVEMLVGKEVDDDMEITVVALYDRKRRIIGLRRGDQGDPNGYAVRKQPSSTSFLVGLRGFFNHYDIDHSEAKRYSAKDYGDGVFGFSLTEPYQLVGREAKN